MTDEAVQARLEEIEGNYVAQGNEYIRWLCQQVRTLLARVAELEAWKKEAAETLFQAGGHYATARQQLAVAQERIEALEGAIRLIRDQVRPVMIGDAYLSATAQVPVAAVEAAASLLAAPQREEGA